MLLLHILAINVAQRSPVLVIVTIVSQVYRLGYWNGWGYSNDASIIQIFLCPFNTQKLHMASTGTQN